MKQKVTKWLDVFSRENIIDKKEIVDDVCYFLTKRITLEQVLQIIYSTINDRKKQRRK